MATHRSRLQCFQNSFIICLETACQQPPRNTFSNEISLCPGITRLLLFEAAVILLVSQKWSLWVTPHYLNTQKFMTHCDLKACPQYKVHIQNSSKNPWGINSIFISLTPHLIEHVRKLWGQVVDLCGSQLMRPVPNMWFLHRRSAGTPPPVACKPNCRRSSSPDLPGWYCIKGTIIPH